MTTPKFPATLDNKLRVHNKKQFNEYLKTLPEDVEVIVRKRTNQRTGQQNRAMHKYFSLVSETLNNSGYTIEKVIESFTVEHDWTPALVKELLWREAQRFAVKKESTTKLDKSQEITKVYEVVNRFLAKLGVESIPFPSWENDYETH